MLNSHVSFAQGEKETLIVNINECLNITMQNNPDIFASHEDFTKSIYQYKISKAQSGVQVNSGIYTREIPKDTTTERIIKIPGKDTDVGLFAGLSATYSLYDPQKYFREEGTRISMDITKLNSIVTRGRILNNVKNAYYDYYASIETTSFYKTRYSQYIFRKNQAKIQYDNGAISILEYTKVDLDLIQMNMDFERSKYTERLRLNDLLNVMGIKSSNILKILPGSLKEIKEIKYSLEDLYKISEIYNPQIIINRLSKQIAKLAIASRRAQHEPTLHMILSLGYLNSKLETNKLQENYNMNNWNPTFGGVISAGLPLYSGGAISASVEIAIIDYNKSIYNERNSIISIKNSINAHIEGLSDIKRQFDLSRMFIEQSKKQHQMLKNNFDSGLASQAELDSAELGFIQAELNSLNIAISYQKYLAAISNLTGVDEEYLCKK